MRTLLLFILLNLSGIAVVRAQSSGIIVGSIVDAHQQPVTGINVTLDNTALGSPTNAQGQFRINNVPVGTYSLLASGIGYGARKQNVTVTAGRSTRLTLQLDETQTMLQEVVVSAGKTSYKTDKVSESLRLQEPLLEVPQNIQVLSSSLIRDQQLFNVTEDFSRNASGISTSGGWTTINAAVTIRGSQSGFGSFRNGMNLANFYAPLNEDMSFVDHIDIIKGPAGFLLSNGEAGGFYNVVTKKPTGQTGGRASFTVGSFSTFRAAADVQGKLDKSGKLLYRLNIAGQTRKSFTDYDFNRRLVVAPVLSYQLTPKTLITGEYTYQAVTLQQLSTGIYSEKGFKTFPRNFYAGDPNVAPTQQREHTAFLTVQHRFNDNWKLTAQGSYNNFRMDAQYLTYDFDRLYENNDGTINRSYWIWDVQNPQVLGQVFVKGQFSTGAVKHHLLAGVDLANKRNHEVYNPVKAGFVLNLTNPQYGLPSDSIPVVTGRRDALKNNPPYNGHDTYAGYLILDELRMLSGERLRLTLGGRYTTVGQTSYDGTTPYHAARFTPRVGLSYSLTPSQSIYGLLDNSFVPQAGSSFDGKNFLPLIGRNLELGWKTNWLGGRLSSTVAAYHIRRTNALTTDPIHTGFSIQTGEIVTQGLEFDLSGQLAPGLNAVANYAYTHSEITKDTDPNVVGTRTTGVAAHIANAWLSYTLPGRVLQGFSVNGGFQLQAHRYGGDYSENPVKNYVTPDNIFSLDAGVNYRQRRIGMALLVNNLTDRYNYIGYRYGRGYFWDSITPRSFRLTVDYSF